MIFSSAVQSPGPRLYNTLALSLVLCAGALGYKAFDSIADGHRGEAAIEGASVMILSALATGAACKGGLSIPFTKPC